MGRGWTYAKRAPSEAIIPLKIGLTQRNMDTLSSLLLSVSDPESESYGQHWTPEQIVAHFAPAKETHDAVLDWLVSNGISSDRTRLSASSGWVSVNVTVAEAEDLLHTEYHIYADNDGTEHIGCDAYSIPEHMAPHVDIVKPTVSMSLSRRPPSTPKLNRRAAPPPKLGSPGSFNGPKTDGRKPGGSTTLGLDDCDEFITPICLQTLYNIHYKPVSTHKNTFGVVEFTPQAFLQEDLGISFSFRVAFYIS